MAETNSFMYHVRVTGEDSGIERAGRFVGKLRIPWKEQLKQDEIRRNLLGERADLASVRAADMANILSFLKLHLIESPDWWKNELQEGMNCDDDNVVVAVHDQLSKEIDRLREEKKKAAELAKGDLKKILDENQPK